MNLYILGIFLILPKLVQCLIEALIDKNLPLILSSILTGIFAMGMFFALTDLVMSGVPWWILVPLIMVIGVGIVILMKMEYKDFKRRLNHKDEK